MVFLPPRHSKSETVSRLFSAYYLYRHPERWVGVNSYAAELAYTLSRAARDNYAEAGGQIRDDAGAVKHWETPAGGGLWAAGVGGPITGKGFHLGIIDDPLKNAEEASSEVTRAKQKEWYSSTFYTREEPQGSIVVIQTRWHEDDLAGWLLSEESEDEEPERWHVVCFPARRPAHEREWPATVSLEPDWRETGEALCPERYPEAKLQKIEKRVGGYYWGALYEQNPTPREGSFFHVSRLQILPAEPVGLRCVRAWDLGATAGSGDPTAGVKIGQDAEGRFIVCDVTWGQWDTDERDRQMHQTSRLDGAKVRQRIPQEPAAAGKSLALAMTRKLAGVPVTAAPISGDKQVRADPFSSQVNAGNVYLVAGPWNKAYIEELRAFPLGTHDDQVDASSDAFNELAGMRTFDVF